MRRVRDSGVGEGPLRGRAGRSAGVRALGGAGVAQATVALPEPDCEVGTWTENDSRIAPVRAAMTDRAGRWVTVQVGREGRTVADVARELGCDWHTVMGAVAAYGTPRVEDPDRIGPVSALGLDETLFARTGRWRTQTLGHRGRRDDPLYRSRRLLTKGHERLDDRGEAKLLGLLEAGDPRGEVRLAWHAKETIRGIYGIDNATEADTFVTELTDDLLDTDHPPEVRSLGRTLHRWHDQIVAWHRSRVTNGPTEAANNLIKRIKRVGFGFRRFAHYRLRVLLYAGRPNWNLIDTIDPAQIR